MPPLNMYVRFLGRPVKPVSFFFMLASLELAYILFKQEGIIQGRATTLVLGVLSVVAAGLFMYGWWNSKTREEWPQRMTEWALLLTSFLWGARFWAGLVEESARTSFPTLGTEGIWLSLCWSGIAAGAWWLEHADTLGRQGRT